MFNRMMDSNTKGNLLVEDLMAWGLNHGLMKQHIRDHISWAKNMGEEHLHGEIGKVRRLASRKHMLVNSRMIYFMDKVGTNGLMVEYMMENGLKEKWKEKGNLFGQVCELIYR